jgi:glycosyltransferase involved in cell wall biosynthesis
LPHADTGGARTHMLGVISGFKALGWQVKPFIVGDHLPIRRMSSTSMTGRAQWRMALDLARLGIGIINRGWAEARFLGYPDLVYERFAAFQALGRPFSRRGVPWIIETQGLDYEERRRDRGSIFFVKLAERIEIAAYRQCDVIICVSKTLKHQLSARPEIDSEKILVIPMAFDPSRFDPNRFSPKDSSSGSLSIVFVSELMRRHRLDLLLRAISDIRRSENIAIELRVAGEGPARAEWEKLCTELDLAEQVRFVGRIHMDAVPEFISKADVGFVGHADSAGSPAHSSPTKLYEYMAMQKPVIAAGADDVHDLVVEGQTGFLFRPGDPHSLAMALRRSHEKRLSLPAMGLAARSKVEVAHTWPARVEAMLQGIDRILSARSE